MSDDPKRLSVMMDSYRNLYYSSGKTAELKTEKLSDIVRAIYSALDPIPTDRLSICFMKASRAGQMPGTYHILKAWDEVRFEDKNTKTVDTSKTHGKEFSGALVPKGTFFTWDTLPRCCWSDKMLELREKYFARTLDEQETSDWGRLMDLKWWAVKERPEDLVAKPHSDYEKRIGKINIA